MVKIILTAGRKNSHQAEDPPKVDEPTFFTSLCF